VIFGLGLLGATISSMTVSELGGREFRASKLFLRLGFQEGLEVHERQVFDWGDDEGGLL
jgi:hypothetical protein